MFVWVYICIYMCVYVYAGVWTCVCMYIYTELRVVVLYELITGVDPEQTAQSCFE